MKSNEVRQIFMKKFGENLKKLREEKYTTFDDLSINSVFDSSKISSLLEIEPKELFDFYFDIKKNKIEM